MGTAAKWREKLRPRMAAFGHTESHRDSVIRHSRIAGHETDPICIM
jgi:hypothetical protein